MNHPVALDAALATSTPERKGEPRLLPMWSFIIVVGIVAIAVLLSDSSLTPEQRFQVESPKAIAFAAIDGKPGAELLTVESQSGRARVCTARARSRTSCIATTASRCHCSCCLVPFAPNRWWKRLVMSVRSGLRRIARSCSCRVKRAKMWNG